VSAEFLDTLALALVPTGDARHESLSTAWIRSHGIVHTVLVLELDPRALVPLVTRLKNEFGFDMFLDVTAVDWPDAALRFEVVHHFYSTRHRVRVRLKQHFSESDPTVDSLISLYGSAAIMERECHDMYGIRFRGNADLRPILLYEGFVGHPLRKDYPKQKEQPLVPYLPPQGERVL
jgi:NADH-quinone oxidoreductase subunit C